ncbi:MAG: hypothetical protein JWN88_900 [Frankiales bacterium]|nr:hypothetical protein [Frankiales bacterium]
MSDQRIDLHAHSTASDGTSSPRELVQQAGAAGLDVVALTDHDTTAGWDEAAQALPAGLSLVRGAEISCVHGGVSLHLLAYLFDPEDPSLTAALDGLRQSRAGRAQEMARQLEAAGTGVTWERVRELGSGSVGRPHLARALVEQGLVPTIAEAFTPQWIGTAGRFWVGLAEIEAVVAVRLITAAGGAAVFAHPRATARGRTVDDAVFATLADAGLVGVEVDHVDHDAQARVALAGLAADLGLVVTGGSDFHGASKPVGLGANGTTREAYERLVGAASGVAVVTA